MADDVTRIQQKLGVHQTGTWDGATVGAVLAYQQSGRGAYPMDRNGHPDPATLVNLGYYTPADVFTAEWNGYLQGGAKPGHLGRDLFASIDQVPRWAWGTVAAAFSVFAYMAYRTDKKRGR